MVDINLIGEEEKKQEAPGRETSFDQDIRLETHDFPTGEQSSYINDLPELTQGRSNTRLFVIIGALIIVIAGVLYMLLKKEPEEAILETLTDPEKPEVITEKPQPLSPQPIEPMEEQVPSRVSEEPGMMTETEAPAMDQPVAELTPIEQEIAESAILGQFVVQSVVNAIGGQAIPTLIRQTGDAFMAEFVAPSDGELAGIMGQLRGELQSGNIKIVHQENYPLHGPTAVKATVTAVGPWRG